jgi:hypothetical protein
MLGSRDGTFKLAIACDAIGFEYAKQVFDRLSPGQWHAMDAALRERASEAASAPVARVLLEVYTVLLGETMTYDHSRGNDEDPFHFLQKIAEEELTSLLRNESPSRIAFISLYWNPDEMNRVFNALPAAVRRQVVLQISRLQRLPEDAIQQVAQCFAATLQQKRKDARPPTHVTAAAPSPIPVLSPNSTPARTEPVAAREIPVRSGDVAEAIRRIVAGIDVTADRRLREYIRQASPALSKKLQNLPSLETTSLIKRHTPERANPKDTTD